MPPACSPELRSTKASLQNVQNGDQCPANKLVITPLRPIRGGATFTVRVAYTGRPGVHHDGDGTTEGWFRSSDGGFVTTEPVASEDWMPLNDFPTAKLLDEAGKGRCDSRSPHRLIRARPGEFVRVRATARSAFRNVPAAARNLWANRGGRLG